MDTRGLQCAAWKSHAEPLRLGRLLLVPPRCKYQRIRKDYHRAIFTFHVLSRALSSSRSALCLPLLCTVHTTCCCVLFLSYLLSKLTCKIRPLNFLNWWMLRSGRIFCLCFYLCGFYSFLSNGHIFYLFVCPQRRRNNPRLKML